jgi:NitT/TauT family transport system substrate-binding protein
MQPFWSARVWTSIATACALAVAACAPPGPAPLPAAPAAAAKPPAPAAAPASPAQPSAAPAAAKTRVRVAYPARIPTVGILAIMKDAGFLDQYGVEAELLQINSPLSVTALLSGEVDFNQVGAEPVMSAKLEGGDTTILSCGTRYAFWYVVGKPHIERPQDLKGLRVANSRRGSNLYEVFQMALGKWGVNPDDVTIVTVDGDPQKILAVQNDAADATIINPPNHLRAMQVGLRPIADIGELAIEWPSSCLATTSRFVADQPAAAKGIVQAYVAAAQWMRTHKNEAVDILMAFSDLDDRAIVEEGYNTYLKYYNGPIPYPNRVGLQTILTSIFSESAGTATPEQFVDDRILRELEAAGFFATTR